MPTASFTLNSDYGFQRVTVFRTLIKDLGNGHEQRISKSTGALRRYRIVAKNRLTTDMDTDLYDFYIARYGAYEAFNITDPFDSSTVLVRFEEDELTEELFAYKLENAQLTVREVVS